MNSKLQSPQTAEEGQNKLPQRKQQELKKMIDQWTVKYEELKNLNRNLGIGLGISAIILSLGATVSGIYGNAKLASVFGALATTIQSIIFAYPLEKRSGFYRVIAAKNMKLSSKLSLMDYTDEDLKDVLIGFNTLRIQAAIEEPYGNEPSELPENHTNKELESDKL